MPGKHFYFLIHGTFAERSIQGAPGKSTTSITGRLLNVTFKSSPTGKIMKVHMADEENFYMISMFLSTRPAYAFLMLLGALKLDQPLTLSIDGSSGKDMLTAVQDGEHVPWLMYSPGFGLLHIQEKVDKLIKRLHGEILPAIQALGNPFPSHKFYKPPKLSRAEILGFKFPVYGERG